MRSIGLALAFSVLGLVFGTMVSKARAQEGVVSELVATCENCGFGVAALNMARGYPIILTVLVAGENDEYSMGLLFTKPTAPAAGSGSDIIERAVGTGWTKTEIPLGTGRRPPGGVGLGAPVPNGGVDHLWALFAQPGPAGQNGSLWSYTVNLDGAGNVVGAPAGGEVQGPWGDMLENSPIVANRPDNSVDVAWVDADGNLRVTTFRDGTYTTTTLGPVGNQSGGLNPWDMGYYPHPDTGQQTSYVAIADQDNQEVSYQEKDYADFWAISVKVDLPDEAKDGLDQASAVATGQGQESPTAAVSTPTGVTDIKDLSADNTEVTTFPWPSSEKQIKKLRDYPGELAKDPESVFGDLVILDPDGTLTLRVRQGNPIVGKVKEGTATVKTFSSNNAVTLMDAAECPDGKIQIVVKEKDYATYEELIYTITVDPARVDVTWD